jgi:hypothetical protein
MNGGVVRTGVYVALCGDSDVDGNEELLLIST